MLRVFEPLAIYTQYTCNNVGLYTLEAKRTLKDFLFLAAICKADGACLI